MAKAHSAEMEAAAAKNQGDATLAEANQILEDLLGELSSTELSTFTIDDVTHDITCLQRERPLSYCGRHKVILYFDEMY